MQKEIWKDIEDYKLLYQVSNLGDVKSLDRIIKNYPSGFRLIKGRILKGADNGKGYLCVSLYKNGNKETKKIHQLVAVAFKNHKPCGYKLVINHIDFNTYNNNVENIEIVTPRKNCDKKHLKSSSIYTGVCWAKNENKWIASISINGRNKYLGYFTCEVSAHLAYEKELNKIEPETIVIK